MKLKLKSPLCFFDLETTGISITQDRIVEIAVLKVMPDGKIERKRDLINPTIPIPKEASAVHGIYHKDVADKPTFKEVAKDYERFFQGADLSGFNILRFDIPMLVEEFLRAEISFDYTRKKIIDTKHIYHLMEKRDLRSAYRFYCKKDLHDAHSAAADTQASMEVLQAQIEQYEHQPVVDPSGATLGTIQNDMEELHNFTTANMIDLAGRLAFNRDGEAVINFGRYKNQPVLKVLRENKTYYTWVMNGDFPLDTKRKLTEIRLGAFRKGKKVQK